MSKESVSHAMDAISHGVYVLGVRAGDQENLMTAAWLCQVSSAPAMLAVAVSASHLTASMIKEAGCFTVSILNSSQKETAMVCGRVSGRKADKTKLVETEHTSDGIPVLKDAAAKLECRVVDVNEKTGHVLFIAEVTDAVYITDDVLHYNKKEYFG